MPSGGVPPAARRRVRGHEILAPVLAVLALVGLLASPAQAQPAPDAIEDQIDVLWREAEPLIEQYNLVREQYEQNLARQAELVDQIQPLAEQYAAAQQRIGRISARIYMGGQAGTLSAMLSTKDPGSFVDQLSYLEGLASAQNTQLADVLSLKELFEAQKAPIDALVEELELQETSLRTQRAEIDARLAQLQELRDKAYVETYGTTSTRPWVCPAEYLPTPGYVAAAFACGEIGKRYVWGTSGPDTYDCSGLTLRAWRQAGVYLPHNAAMQRRSMPYVDRADLQIGDLVFYYDDLSHVGIYVGDGHIVHAPRSGDVVRMVNLDRGAKIHSFGRPG